MCGAPLVPQALVGQLAMVPGWHPHWDVWALVLILAAGYAFATHRSGPHLLIRSRRERAGVEGSPASSAREDSHSADDRPRSAIISEPTVTRRQIMAFAAGLALLWVVSDWPLHDIAEQRLFMFHMVEHIALGLAVPPLLLVGMPTWMQRRLFANRFVLPLLRPLVYPLVAFVLFDLTMVGIHWPASVNLMVSSPFAHFGIHGLLFLISIIMWLPLLSRIPELPRLSPPIRMLYLFAHSLLPTIPASFLTFGSTPLYSSYAEAPRLWGIDAVTDQAIAGLIMKLGGGAILWGVIIALWFRWYADEQRRDALEHQTHQST